jgi:FMN phosphatase YigB (HAD superfamily)
MIISFDIDNTLIPYSDEFEVEEKTLLSKLLRAEPIRKGTINLFHDLKNRGHEIWIYTTSFRSPMNLKKTFKSYGLHTSKIINEKTNQKQLRKNNCTASKNPRLFRIDIHIDDSKGVGMEGKKYGFKTIIIDTNDLEWVDKVKRRIDILEIDLH